MTEAVRWKRPRAPIPMAYTTAALSLAIIVLAVAAIWELNVFDLPGVSVIGLEKTEVGQIAIAFLLVIPAIFIDRVVARQRAHEAAMQAEQLRVLQVTMRTVQDIVNNNLNQLQVLRFEAEGHVSTETLAEFDAALRGTATRLTAIGEMRVFVEMDMAAGSGLDVHGGEGAASAGNRRPPDERA